MMCKKIEKVISFMTGNKLLIFTFIISVLSLVSYCHYAVRFEPYIYNCEKDFHEPICTILCFLVTVLIGWQVLIALGLSKKTEDITKKLDNEIKSMNTRVDECNKLISEFKIEVKENMDKRIAKYNKMTTTRERIVREIEKMNNEGKIYGEKAFKDYMNLIEMFGKLDLDDYSNCSIINNVQIIISISKERKEEITLTKEEHHKYINIIENSNEEIRDSLLKRISDLTIKE